MEEEEEEEEDEEDDDDDEKRNMDIWREGRICFKIFWVLKIKPDHSIPGQTNSASITKYNLWSSWFCCFNRSQSESERK